MITVTDCGDYFRVIYDQTEVCNVAKHPKGFTSAAELKAYLEAWNASPLAD